MNVQLGTVHGGGVVVAERGCLALGLQFLPRTTREAVRMNVLQSVDAIPPTEDVQLVVNQITGVGCTVAR